ncbi:MAG: hypothetical protein EON88_05980 [Brevundimonas sp.]|nr:MAG: hypothetical protein EON88_05980 [Brevundimonas sp.]
MAAYRVDAGQAIRGLHGLLLSFPVALFTSAVFTDIAYLRSAEIQWTNFSAWLIAGAMVFCGIVAAWALVRLVVGFRGAARIRLVTEFALLAVLFVLGLVNSFKHSQDGWSSVGAFGLVLSILCALLALASAFITFSASDQREFAR